MRRAAARLACALLFLLGCDRPDPGPHVIGGGLSEPLELGPPPHVSLLFVAGLRREDLGCYGGPAAAGLDRLAALGSRFDTFLAPVPDGQAALASLRSGAWPGPEVSGSDLVEELVAGGYRLEETPEPLAFVQAAVAADRNAPRLWCPPGLVPGPALEGLVAGLVGALEDAGVGSEHLVVLAGTGELAPPPDGEPLRDGTLLAPLVIAWPGTVPAGEARPQVVGHPDVAPTVLELVGLPRAEPEPRLGSSFARLTLQRTQGWRGSHLSFQPAGDPTLFRLRATSWSLCAWRDGRRMLFDLRTDALETRDVAGTPGAAQMQGVLEEELRRWVRALGWSGEGL